jgi:AAA family ATP:ADP antiporter
MTDDDSGAIKRMIRAATRIEPNELKATILSFIFVFILMASYFILRPVRNAMASDWTDVELTLLWIGTFVFSLVAVTVYGAIIPRVRVRQLVAGVYVFFTLTFFGFYLAALTVVDRGIVNAAYYVWVSVFSLFHVSVFWSFMADVYNRQQAPRLFAFIAAGGSLGAITGPAITVIFAEAVGTYNLLLLSAVMLLIPIPIIATLSRLKVTELGNEDVAVDLSEQVRIGRNPFAGFTLLFSTPMLFGIAVFIFLYVSMGTFVYFGLKNLMEVYDEATRERLWALIDLTVNSLAVFTAMFLTGRFVVRFGMPTTLAIVPFCLVAGFLSIAMMPLLAAVVALEIARRAGNYAVTRPAREMLYTVVNREMRFKSKPVIDIVIYRGGDSLWAVVFTALTTGVGLGMAGVAWIGAAIALVWALVGVWLGRKYHRADSVESAQVAAK